MNNRTCLPAWFQQGARFDRSYDSEESFMGLWPTNGDESPRHLSFRAERGICFFLNLTAKADSSPRSE